MMLSHKMVITLLLLSTTSSTSIDCQDVVNFATSLNMNVKQPILMNEIVSNCCTTTGITCDGNNVVTIIHWTGLNLNGTVNETAIPSNLTELYLYSNQLIGLIPTNLPLGLKVVSLDSNEFTGTLPNVWKTDGLQGIYFGHNKISGGISSKWPSKLVELYLYDNLLSGTIPNTQVWPSGLQTLYLHGNKLNGDGSCFPSTILSLSLGYQGYSGNKFTGTLALEKPTAISINSNLISDLNIKNTSSLTFCDLSNNPLLGDKDLINLSICAQTGIYALYSASSTILVFPIGGPVLILQNHPTLWQIIAMVVKIVIEFIVLAAVTYTTPYKREIGKALKTLLNRVKK